MTDHTTLVTLLCIVKGCPAKIFVHFLWERHQWRFEGVTTECGHFEENDRCSASLCQEALDELMEKREAQR